MCRALSKGTIHNTMRSYPILDSTCARIDWYMGVVEKEAKQIRRLRAFQQGILAAIAIGGIVLIAATVPNAVQLLRHMPGYKKGARFNHQAKTALGRLAAKGLVTFFDIPERRRGVRSRLRLFMSEYGFVRLQDSVWIYPYDCEDLIALAKANLRIGVDVLYMIVERLERDTHLREQFNLRSA